jgi:cytochrome b subunit of formate dehydrogenase
MADTHTGYHSGSGKYKRFRFPQRLEHWLFMASFTILGVTGLIQKYHDLPISQAIVSALGGITNTRLVHHSAAFIMMLVTIYHIGAVAYRIYVRRVPLSMLPDTFDLKVFWKTVRYYIFLDKEPAQQGRFTFEEKAEYWAVVWGTVVMAVTGFMMWNPIATTKFLPGGFIPAAKIAHGLEAVLAVAAIFVWHLYHVLVKTFNKSMFTGFLSQHQMEDEHPLELADIKAGTNIIEITPGEKKKRVRRFWPVYGITAAAMLVGVYFFVNYEETAIATVPPAEDVVIFAPLTPTPLPTPVPTRTPPPGGLASWDAGVSDLFVQRCGICHNPAGMIGGLDLTTYEAGLAGGDSGPGIIPGDPDNSSVIIVQAHGGHLEQLSADELEQVYDWIQAGAP